MLPRSPMWIYTDMMTIQEIFISAHEDGTSTTASNCIITERNGLINIKSSIADRHYKQTRDAAIGEAIAKSMKGIPFGVIIGRRYIIYCDAPAMGELGIVLKGAVNNPYSSAVCKSDWFKCKQHHLHMMVASLEEIQDPSLIRELLPDSYSTMELDRIKAHYNTARLEAESNVDRTLKKKRSPS